MSILSPKRGAKTVVVDSEKLLMEDLDSAEEFDFWKFLKREFGVYEREYRINEPKHYKKSSDIINNVMKFFTSWVSLEFYFFIGNLICADLFLSTSVMLPVRVVVGGVSVLVRRRFHPYHVFDFLRILTLCLLVYLLFFIDYSYLYHYVREQSMLKLYVMYNMLGIFDKLSSTFGEDLEDFMFYHFTCSSSKSSFALRIVFCFISFFGFVLASLMNSVSHLLKLTILNVSVNSRTSTLIQLLISINFVELKKRVFKRFSDKLFFQTFCKDIVERFILLVFSVLILFKNIKVGAVLYPIAYLLMSEVVVDLIKHNFILRYNIKSVSLYRRFSLQLFRDLLSVNKKVKKVIRLPLRNKVLDYHNHLCRRLGLLTVPLVAVFVRSMCYSFGWISLFYFFVVFFFIKLSISWVITLWAYSEIKKAETNEDYESDTKLLKNVFRYALVEKRIAVY